jgi:hypothetical protein
MRLDELFRLKLVESGDIAARAKALFGVTHNPLEAGYILADGTMLDLSGRHQVGEYVRDPSGVNRLKRPGRDYMADTRLVDHREINDLYDLADNSLAMRRFMAEAPALRCQPKFGFEANAVPTPKQVATALVGHFAVSDEPIDVDVTDPVTGQTLASKSFARKAAGQIIPFIKASLG